MGFEGRLFLGEGDWGGRFEVDGVFWLVCWDCSG